MGKQVGMSKMSENEEKTMIDNLAKDDTFWVVVGSEMRLFTDKGDATLKTQAILAETPDTTLAEISYNKTDRKFEVNPVPWKEISQLSSVGLLKAQKEIEALRKELAAKEKD